jgi:DNA polymerase-1
VPSPPEPGLLLAVDGDNFAHRAYHALPKTIKRAGGRPAGALVGFGNALLRLWDDLQPAAVMAAWDLLAVPNFRAELLPGYQADRVFDDPLLEQLDLMPGLVESFGFVSAQAGGYEADDFLAAAAARWPGPVVVASNDRDAFQLVSDRVSVLQPVKGGGFARVGPEEVRERYGVDPVQVPDFIALRGDQSDRIPGAPGVGPKSAASVLREYGTLEAALAAGRFAPIADDLRLYRRVATMDAGAPLPDLRETPPDWSRAAAAARDLGLDALSRRIAERT